MPRGWHPRAVAPRCSLDDRTAVHDDDDRFASQMEGTAHILDHVAFQCGEVEFLINTAVYTFASLSSDGDDGSVCIFHVSVYATLGYFNLRHLGLSELQKPHHGVSICLEFHFRIIYISDRYRSKSLSCRCRCFQSFHHVSTHVRRMHAA